MPKWSIKSIQVREKDQVLYIGLVYIIVWTTRNRHLTQAFIVFKSHIFLTLIIIVLAKEKHFAGQEKSFIYLSYWHRSYSLRYIMPQKKQIFPSIQRATMSEYTINNGLEAY
jgi:hypothetical protein